MGAKLLESLRKEQYKRIQGHLFQLKVKDNEFKHFFKAIDVERYRNNN
jgi:hypothetical protein